MSDVRRCACGASLRIPPELQGRPVRCPRCKASVPGTQSQAAPSIEGQTQSATPTSQREPVPNGEGHVFAAGADELGLTCPICLSHVESGQLVHRCPECDIVHHEECWLEIGGCGTFGCKQAPAIDKGEQTAQAPLTAWGDTKKCPVCGETIKSIAVKCRYCGEEFGTVGPLTAADLRQQFVKRQESHQFRNWVIATFVASLTGCLAPFSLVFGLAYILPRRDKLAKAGPLVHVLGWVSIALSGFYCVLILAFYAFSQ